jgi:hypothetical protein
MPYEQLVAELRELQAYEIELESKHYQVEVEIVKHSNTEIHVIVAVDDGSLPAAITPSTHLFVRRKDDPSDQ